MAPQFGLPLLAFDQATTRKVVASVVKVGAVVNVGATVTATDYLPSPPRWLSSAVAREIRPAGIARTAGQRLFTALSALTQL